MSEVIARYRNQRLGTAFFLRARWATTPYARMASRLPQRGKILDLGCGHGLLAFALVDGSAEREVLGVDHDSARIALAQEASGDHPRLQFRQGGLLEIPSGPFDGISLIDVMHYFSYEEQEKILRSAFASLAPGGTLILREVNPDGGLVSSWNRLYEKLATWSGFTRSDRAELFFRKPAEWTALLEKIGMSASHERCSSVLFADVLFIGKKETGP